jgi:hypothetical protein
MIRLCSLMFGYVRLTGEIESLCAGLTIPFPSWCMISRGGLLSAGRDATALRACLKNPRGAAARDFGGGQGGEVLPHGHQHS